MITNSTTPPREITILVPGRIGGKGRPRFARTNGRPMVYTPTKTRDQENHVRQLATLEMRRHKLPIFLGPLALGVCIIQTHPITWNKSKCERNRWITSRPDADNCIKLIGDALNGIVWSDDAQIAQIAFSRTYGQTNSVEIAVIALE